MQLHSDGGRVSDSARASECERKSHSDSEIESRSKGSRGAGAPCFRLCSRWVEEGAFFSVSRRLVARCLVRSGPRRTLAIAP